MFNLKNISGAVLYPQVLLSGGPSGVADAVNARCVVKVAADKPQILIEGRKTPVFELLRARSDEATTSEGISDVVTNAAERTRLLCGRTRECTALYGMIKICFEGHVRHAPSCGSHVADARACGLLVCGMPSCVTHRRVSHVCVGCMQMRVVLLTGAAGAG